MIIIICENPQNRHSYNLVANSWASFFYQVKFWRNRFSVDKLSFKWVGEDEE